jgi:nicotinamidase-related amidase
MSEAVSEPFPIRLSSTAFLIVDMQNDFVRVGAPLEVPDSRWTLPVIREMSGAFRKAGRPVIYTRFVAGPQETLLWKWSPQIYPPVNCCRIGFRRHYQDLGVERECIAVVDELAPLPGDYVVDKFGYGAFFRTNLPDILQATGTDTLVICGTVTQICVEETGRQSFHHGYKTVLLRDAVSSFDPQLHEATLKNFAMKFGMVLNSGELLRRLAGGPGGASAAGGPGAPAGAGGAG